MDVNVSQNERIFRGLLGAILILGGGFKKLWGWIGLILIGTAIAGRCSLYTLLDNFDCTAGVDKEPWTEEPSVAEEKPTEE